MVILFCRISIFYRKLEHNLKQFLKISLRQQIVLVQLQFNLQKEMQIFRPAKG